MRFFRRLSFVAACTIASVLVPASAGAATYYVDPAGSDASAGTSEAQAWKTVGKVNGKTLAPGDVVLLKGGARFGTMLEPRGSGTAEAPITFGSYGTGRALLDPVGGGSGWAGIALSGGQSHLRFERLEIARWGAGNSGVYIGGPSHHLSFDDLYVHDVHNGFLAAQQSTASYVNITNSRIDSLLRNTGSIGINLTPDAHHWAVSGTTIANAGDSCVIDLGHDNTYDGLTVNDCGWWIKQYYGGHGLYLRGPNLTVRNSTVWNAPTNCISIRFQNAVVENNTAHDCAVGVGYFEYATANDTPVRINRNRIWNTSTAVYVDWNTKQRYHIANNSIVAGNEGIVVRGGTRLAVENNLITGSGSTLLAWSAVPSVTERANDFHTSRAGGPVFGWPNGSGGFAAYRSATGLGAGSTTADPGVVSAAGTPDLRLADASPLLDAGVADPATGALAATCDGGAESYCGSAPDIGAFEAGAGTPPPSIPGDPPSDPVTPPSDPGDAAERSRAAERPVTPRAIRCTPPSDPVTPPAAPPAADRKAPTAPSSLRALDRATTWVKLGWKAARDNVRVDGYRVYRVGVAAPVARVSGTAATVAGLKASTAYAFYVVAVDAAGNVSGRSAVVKASTTRPTAAARVRSGRR